MNATSARTALLAAALSALWVLGGTVYFAGLRADYSHVTHTISELGAAGAPHAAWVSFAVFLPVGLLVWLALALAKPLQGAPGGRMSVGGYVLVGLGYVAAAFFPCDPGAPLIGTWRHQVHSFFGLLEYVGAVVALWAWGRQQNAHGARMSALGSWLACAIVAACLVLLGWPAYFAVRGAVQRIAEVVIFGGLMVMCLRPSIKPAPA